MADPTDTDRERAAEIMWKAAYAGLAAPAGQQAIEREGVIAAALAAERERALAPIRALAERLDEDWEAVMVDHDHDECLGDIIRHAIAVADRG